MIKPGDMVTAKRSEWVWPTPELWNGGRSRDERTMMYPEDVGLVLSALPERCIVWPNGKRYKVVMIIVKFAVGYIPEEYLLKL